MESIVKTKERNIQFMNPVPNYICNSVRFHVSLCILVSLQRSSKLVTKALVRADKDRGVRRGKNICYFKPNEHAQIRACLEA
jgi:hypothetical protein